MEIVIKDQSTFNFEIFLSLQKGIVIPISIYPKLLVLVMQERHNKQSIQNTFELIERNFMMGLLWERLSQIFLHPNLGRRKR